MFKFQEYCVEQLIKKNREFYEETKRSLAYPYKPLGFRQVGIERINMGNMLRAFHRVLNVKRFLVFDYNETRKFIVDLKSCDFESTFRLLLSERFCYATENFQEACAIVRERRLAWRNEQRRRSQLPGR